MEEPHLTTRMIVEQLRAEGQRGVTALDIKARNNAKQDFMQESGIFAHVDEVHFRDGVLEPKGRSAYDIVLVVDKSVFVDMDPSKKAAFLDMIMNSTSPGGIHALSYHVTYPLNGNNEAVPLEFERGISGLYQAKGWTVLSHGRDMFGEKMKFTENPRENPWAEMLFIDVKHEYLIVQKPGGEVSKTSGAFLEAARQ